jgi:hypothetical protein
MQLNDAAFPSTALSGQSIGELLMEETLLKINEKK